MAAAESHNLTAYQHQLAAEHVVGGDAVFEAMHPAGVFGNIAADGAGDLRRRIWCVVEARVLHRLRDRKIGHAGLDHGDAIVEIDRADAIEFGHAEKDAVAERQRAARQRGPGPPRHDLDAFAMTVTEHGRNLLGRFRKHDHPGTMRLSAATISARRASTAPSDGGIATGIRVSPGVSPIVPSNIARKDDYGLGRVTRIPLRCV